MSEISKLIAEIKSEGIIRAGNKLEQLYSLAEQMEKDYAALQQKLDAMAAENAAMKVGAEYFMYGPDCGFERYDSQGEAVKAANEMIDDYREDAADGWCDEVDQVCFGVVLSYARQHDVQSPSEDNGYLGSVNYMMSAPETPATDAYLNSVRAEVLNELCIAFVQHTELAGLADDEKITLRECTDAVLHCAEQIRSGTHDTADKAG